RGLGSPLLEGVGVLADLGRRAHLRQVTQHVGLAVAGDLLLLQRLLEVLIGWAALTDPGDRDQSGAALLQRHGLLHRAVSRLRRVERYGLDLRRHRGIAAADEPGRVDADPEALRDLTEGRARQQLRA